MKCISSALLAVGLLAGSATPALAQSGNYGYGGDRYGTQGEAQYDYARVVRVDPVLDGGYGDSRTTGYGNQRCYETTTAGGYERNGGYPNGYGNTGYPDGYGGSGDGHGYNQGARNVATIVGGIAGAVLGSQVGGGSGTYVATAIGSMVGGMAGRHIYDRTQQDRYVRPGTVRVCDPEPVSGGYGGYNDGYRSGNAGGYDVTYEYNGRRYTRRMDYHPGERVRVRVDVTPQ
ncbi:MAG TPA: glycine zipper 2TM domain-containing protein [Thermomonas sp.]|nr:glycine zipper 2TM domain-containing protein [Thermomonas sp.]